MRDFYELELQTVSGVRGWSVPETKGGGPSARESHTAVAYSSLGSSKLYIFGGMLGRRLDDLWQLDLGNNVYVLLYFIIFFASSLSLGYLNFLIMMLSLLLDTMFWSSLHTRGSKPLPRSLHSANVIGNK